MYESLEHDKTDLVAYHDWLRVANGSSGLLDEDPPDMIMHEALHRDEVNKVQCRPSRCVHSPYWFLHCVDVMAPGSARSVVSVIQP